MPGNNALKVKFWGVRGSYPQCHSDFKEVGGNTSCVSLETGNQYLILDAGTGIIGVGDEISRRGLKKATLLISHPHADHISGLPFFKPLHQPDFDLTIIACGLLSAGEQNGGIESILATLVSPPYFPVPWDQICCQRSCVDVPVGGKFTLGHVKVSTLSLDHPGGSTGYRLEVQGKSVCYITDTTHTPGQLSSDLVSFVHRTDLMIYDAAFTEEEFAAKPRWGHSTWNQAVAIAKAGAIGELALFHHDPGHDDAFLAAIETQAKEHFSRTFLAKQGMTRVIS